MRLWQLCVTCGILAAATSAPAANLIVNGDFELTTLPGSHEFGGQYPVNQLLGWATDSYSFVFAPGTADSSGSTGSLGVFALWGPNNGGANGLTPASPAGGNFIGSDGTYLTSPITQTISGLTAGSSYDLSFWWAAGQQYGYNGATTSGWNISIGNQTFATPTAYVPEHGFAPWTRQSFNFVAQESTAQLALLAFGAPMGQPPLSLIDGIQLDLAGGVPSTAPEPGTWAMSLLGFLAIGSLIRRQRSRAPIQSRSAFPARLRQV